MRVLKIFAVILLIIFVTQGKIFNKMPDITAQNNFFDFLSRRLKKIRR